MTKEQLKELTSMQHDIEMTEQMLKDFDYISKIEIIKEGTSKPAVFCWLSESLNSTMRHALQKWHDEMEEYIGGLEVCLDGLKLVKPSGD